MRTVPAQPNFGSQTVDSPFTIAQYAGHGLDDKNPHMKLEPPAKFMGKGLPTVRDWVEETEN